MIEAVNPFNDPEFKKQIIKDQGGINSVEYEMIEEEPVDFKSIISGTPVIPNEKKISNLIIDASALAKNEKEARAQEMTTALNTVFSNYNKQFGLDLNINLNSLSQTLINLSDSRQLRTLELFISKVFRSYRAILILHLIQKLTLAIDYVTDPQRMFGQDLSTADVFIVVEKLIQYIDQLNELKGEVLVKGDDLELKKISEEISNSTDLDSEESKKTIQSFMDLFNKDFNNK